MPIFIQQRVDSLQAVFDFVKALEQLDGWHSVSFNTKILNNVRDHCLQAVFDFVESLDQLDSWRYSLVSTYPRLTLSQQSAQQSLSQLQLVPQATLFVQPED